MSEREIFIAALQQPDGGARSTYLNSVCTGDSALRRRIDRLLAMEENAGSFLEKPVIRPLTAVGSDSRHTDTAIMSQLMDALGSAGSEEGVGGCIGPYRLLHKLGEGGMGTVYVAEQEHPFQRRVALKIIRPGLDSARTIVRFEAERQALALMDHPNIARVLDGGTTQDGRPYLVMELVKGVPITRYCDDNRLPVRERLELLLPVCQAIQHAHHKGIIHRDVKPANVLVALQEGRPVPKVIDFGVAKALNQRLTEQTLQTELGSVLGTLEYMSPEQAELSELDVDTRSDVYALGVLLYELLTGNTPLDKKRLKGVAFLELLRRIREEEPPRPSTRLTTGEELPALASQRRTEPRLLEAEVRGELDWIVLKALEKDRTRRYDSPASLARDVERHLHDEAVEACPPNAGYRLRKLARKHRHILAPAAGFVLLLLLGVVISTWQAVRAIVAEQDALTKENDTEKARKEAVANAAKASAAATAAQKARHKALDAAQKERTARQEEEAERKRAEAVVRLLEKVISDVNPRTSGLDLKQQLIAHLDRAAAHLDAEHAAEPQLRARLRHSLGVTQLGLALYDKAVVLLEQAWKERRLHLPPDHPLTLETMNNLAVAYRSTGQLTKALELHETVLAKRRAKLGPDHPATLATMANFGVALRIAGQVQRALPLLEEALQRQQARSGLSRVNTLLHMGNLAAAYQDVGQFDKALPLWEKALAGLQARVGPDHPHTLNCGVSLGAAYALVGRLDRAVPLLEQTLAKMETKLGPDHPETLAAMNTLGGAYKAADQIDRAIPLLERSLAKLQIKVGLDHPDTLTCMNNLAGAYQAIGALDKAVPLFEQTLARLKAKLGPDHPTTLACMNNLAAAYGAARQLDKSVALYEETLARTKAKLGINHLTTLTCMHNLAGVYRDGGQLDRALPLLEHALARLKAQLGPEHPNTLATLNSLALGYLAAHQAEKALPLLNDFVAGWRKRLGPDHPELTSKLLGVGLFLIRYQQPAAAEPLLDESLATYARRWPDHWMTFQVRSLLGATLLSQGKLARAEPLLVQGYQGLKAREATIPPQARLQVTAALLRVVQFYAATGQMDKADQYRQELAARLAQAQPK